MGYYVNPPTGSKEVWLAENGHQISTEEAQAFWVAPLPGYLPVCLVDNGAFTAAGIGFDLYETECFLRSDDPRPKTWWLVKKEDLLTFLPERLHTQIDKKEMADE